MLNKQLVHLPLRGGIDNKTDKRLVIPNKLDVLQDCVFDDADTLRTRGGLASDVTGLAAASRIFPYGRGFVVESPAGANVVRPDIGQTYPIKSRQITDAGVEGVSNFNRVGMQTSRVASGPPYWPLGTSTPQYIGNMDAGAVAGSFSVWAFEDRDPLTGKIYLRVVFQDEVRRQTLSEATVRDVTGTYSYGRPRLVSTGSLVHLYYTKYTTQGGSTDDWDLCHRPITNITAVELGSETVIQSITGIGGGAEGAASTRCLFDGVYCPAYNSGADGPYVGLVVREGPPYNITFWLLDATDGVTTVMANFGVPSSRPNQLTACWTVDGSNVGRLFALFEANSNSGSIRCIPYVDTNTVGSEATAASTGGATNSIGRIVAYDPNPGANDPFVLGYDACRVTTWTSPVDARTDFWTATASKASGTNASIGKQFEGWHIHAKPFYLGDRYWLPMMIASALQPTVYVVDLSTRLDYNDTDNSALGPLVLARIDYGECGRLADYWVPDQRVPNCFISSNEQLNASQQATIPYMKWERNYLPVNNKNATPLSIARADLDLASQLGHAEINGLTYLAGACPMVFDGVERVEESFHHAPEIVGGTVAATGAGTYGPFNTNALVGTIAFCFTMTWRDAQGNWHESSPSSPKNFTTTSGNLDLSVTVIRPPTLKGAPELVMYRTAIGGTTFYRALDPWSGVPLTDAQLVASGPLTLPVQANEILYVSEGRLPNEPMPACRAIAVHQNRLVVMASDNSTVAYSKEAQQGYAPAFSSEFTKRITSDYGRGVAAISIDDKLAVLGEYKVGVILGSGPNDLGQGSSYTDPQQIVGNYGLRYDSPKGAGLAAEGIWFMTSFGPRLIGRNLALSRDDSGKEAGSEVDYLAVKVGSQTSHRYAAACLIGGSKQQVRFYLTGNTTGNDARSQCLIWDSLFGQWSEFTNHASIDAAYVNNRFYHLTTSNGLRFNDEGTFTDPGPVAVTGSFTTAWLEFGGIQGFQRLYRLKITGKNLDSSSAAQTFTISGGYDYGETLSSLVAATSVATVNTGTIQLEHHLVRQKCTALKLRFTFTSGTSRLRVTELTLQVGLKQGLNKIPSGQRIK